MQVYSSKKYQDFQYNLHGCPRMILVEIERCFPDFKKLAIDKVNVTVVLIFQRSEVELASWGDKQQQEKDRLLEIFVKFAEELHRELEKNGIWSDFPDPCSGKPWFSAQSNFTFSDIDCAEVLTHYRTESVGSCRILLHPQWGTAVYPTTFISTCTTDKLVEIIQKLDMM